MAGHPFARRHRSTVARLLVFVLLSAVLLSQCWVNQNDLWDSDKLPPQSPVSGQPTLSDVPFGELPLQKLDLYMPSKPAIGVILWFHSGGWCCGDKSGVDPLILSTLDKGYAVVSSNYRLFPAARAEQQMADADRALRFVKAKRSSWGAGAGKVLVAGGSAGGTLALLLAGAPGYFSGSDIGALAGVDPRVDGVISLVGPSDLRPYVNGTIGGWGPTIVEGFLGCSDLGSQWPQNATTSTSTAPTSVPVTTQATPSSSTPVEGDAAIDFAALSGSTTMPRCDPNRVLWFSPILWAVLAAMFGGDLPPAYLAYGGLDELVPPSSQGVILHDWWAAGGSWIATYYDSPATVGHNVSFEVNATAFSLWLSLFASP